MGSTDENLKLGCHANDRKLFIQTLLHSVDLGNVTLPFRLCEKWAYKITKEMKQQTIKEDELGIPSLEFMRQDDLISICKNQAGFIGFICEPLWKCVVSAFPEIT